MPVTTSALKVPKLQSSSNFIHGYNRDIGRHPIYSTWANMVQRCTNPNNTHYDRYGGRGISVCERWRSFTLFLEDMGTTWKEGLTLDRWPNRNGNYEPENCRWATRRQQCRNTSFNHLFTLNGETLCLQEWADRLGVSYVCILWRLKRGWTVERALTQPSLRK